MITQGVRLAELREDADVIVEAGLAAYGTDSQKDEFGITESDALPDLHLCIRDTQYGVAKLSMFAWEKETGHAVWQTPVMRADGYQEIRSVLATGPYYSGTIEHLADRIERRHQNVAR